MSLQSMPMMATANAAYRPVYLSHFGLSHQPFRLTPGVDCFFAGADRGDVLNALAYALLHGDGIVSLTGEVGSGKTTLARVLMSQSFRRIRFVYVANPFIGRDELLGVMADELGLGTVSDQPPAALMRHIQRRLIAIHADGEQVVMLVDEAQAMPIETLQQVRLISNLETSLHKLLQVVLVGQPELNELLRHPDLRPLRERITNQFVLAPMSASDVRRYLAFRLDQANGCARIFDARAIDLMVRHVDGLSRRINILADKCLLAAYVDGSHTVLPCHARTAIKEVAFQLGIDHPLPLGGRTAGMRAPWAAIRSLLGRPATQQAGRYSY